MRLFFAIELDPASRQRLDALIDSSSAALSFCGRLTEPENRHVTLLFVGEWPEQRLAELTGLLDRIAARHNPFLLTLDRFGVFGGSGRPRRDRRGGRPGEGQQILWLGDGQLRHPPAGLRGLDADRQELLSLVRDLRDGAAALGIEPDTRPYFPHLTITRKLPVIHTDTVLASLPAFAPIQVAVSRLALMQSVPQSGRMDYHAVHLVTLKPTQG